MPRSSTTYRPGQSGNPAGRPRGAYGWQRRWWTMALSMPAPQSSVTPEQADELVTRALSGQVSAIRELCDVIEYGRVDPDDDGWDKDEDDDA
jgi:hypothetical protein